MKHIFNILSVIALLFVGFFCFVIYAVNEKEVPYIYKGNIFSNIKYAEEMKPYTSYHEDRAIQVFEKPDPNARVIDTWYGDVTFEAVCLDWFPEDNPLSQVDHAHLWFMLPDDKGYVCQLNVIEDESASNKATKKNKKKPMTYEYGKLKFCNDRTALGKILSLTGRPNANYIIMSIIVFLVLVDLFLNKHLITKEQGDYGLMKLSLPISLITNTLLIIYFYFMLWQNRTGFILWYINPWEIGWWVILSAVGVSAALMGNSILTGSTKMFGIIPEVFKDKSEQWTQKIFFGFVSVVYYIVGLIGGLLSFVFGLLGAVLVYTAIHSPKILLQATAEAFDPEKMFNEASKSSSSSSSSSSYSESSSGGSDFSPTWDATTRDEDGNERKLREVNFNTFEDDQGRHWKQTGMDTVERDD